MSSVLSTFAQKLNISSPKSHRPRTSRKASLTILAKSDGELPHLLELKSPFSSLSPLSPRFAFNLLRRSDLDSTDDKSRTDCNEDVFDPFSRASPSVFRSDGGKPSHEPIVNFRLSRLESSFETDDPEVQARSPLNDLSVYLYRPPQAHADTPSKVKSRLHIWVSGIEPQSPTTGIKLAAQTAAQPRIPPRGPRRKNRRPKLRPLVLPNQAALREIVNPQQESIVSSACPSAVPQQEIPHRASHQTASSDTVSADTALGSEHGRPIASTLPPPELVTSTDVFPVARRSSRESISESVIVRGDGDGNVVVAPQQTEGLSQPQCHYQEEPPQLKHEGATGQVALQHRRNCDKPLPEEPLDKPLPRDPLDKPLPQVPPEARLDGLISLLHQAGVIADSAQSLRALALACGSGHVACSSVYPTMLLKGSASTDLRRALLEAVNDKAGQDHFAGRSSSLWSIATQWAYAL
ncbi:hypothetical protein LXA43DRAFT_1138397 [Ganoderma leucocontextum]|nr:hypothetical protein LXA43DRAFT_1138397 [Ganoderma leucocontextum]